MSFIGSLQFDKENLSIYGESQKYKLSDGNDELWRVCSLDTDNEMFSQEELINTAHLMSYSNEMLHLLMKIIMAADGFKNCKYKIEDVLDEAVDLIDEIIGEQQ